MCGAMAERGTCRLCGSALEQYGRAGRHSCCRQCTAKAGGDAGRTVRTECKECGRAFAAATLRARYCSDECRIEGRRRRVRECIRRYLADPGKRAIMMAQRRARAASRRAEKEREARGNEQRQPRPRPRRTAGRAAARKSSVCRLCGCAFEQYGRTGRHSYCRQCTARADREVARTLRVECGICGKEFSSVHRAVRYCSTACSAEARRRGAREGARRRVADQRRRAAAAAPASAGAGPAARGGGKEQELRSRRQPA